MVMRLSEPPRGGAGATQTDITMMQYAEHTAQITRVTVFSTLHHWHLGLDKPLLLGAVCPRMFVTSSDGKWHPAKLW